MRKLKEKFEHPAFITALFLAGIACLALPFYSPGEMPNVLLFFGRLHPVVLHFPIVIIILTLLFEVARNFRLVKIPDNVITILLLSASAFTIVSISAGFFLFASGDYAGDLMQQHFWAGCITGYMVFTTVGLFIVYRSITRFYPYYVVSLIITNIVVGYTSHLGGSITHGQDYLTEHLELMRNASKMPEAKPEAEMLVYEDMLVPIFEAKCISCHNTQRAKGNFVMTSYDRLKQGGESDLPAITPSAPEKSELFNRIVLPENHKDHMPPEGKTPFTDQEIYLLKFWIEAGAVPDLRVEQAREDSSINTVIKNLLPELSRYRKKAAITNLKLKATENELAHIAAAQNLIIRKDTLAEDDYFTIAMSFPPAPFTNDQFRLLHPYGELFTKASLVSSGIDDAGLYYIGQMKNLEKLFLQKTRIDGNGLIHLQHLSKLKVLNLSFTNVDDKAVIDLLKIPNLEEVYLYRTKTTRQVTDAIQKNKPGMKIYLQEGPYF